LQESDLVRTLNPRCRVPIDWEPDYRGLKYQRILYDKVQIKEGNDGSTTLDTHIVGIRSKERGLFPDLTLSRYPGFFGSKVEAMDLNPLK
jgi:hypothetical protein